MERVIKRRVRDRQNERIHASHRAIRERYDTLRAEMKAADPLLFQFVAKGYYVEKIFADPVIGLSKNYIQRIINGK